MARKKIGVRRLKQILAESAANINAAPLQTVIQIGDRHYYETRAIELIRNAREAGPDEYHADIMQAITLLALARMEHEAATT